ncbi:multicopper oxidase family protein [Stappia taiwanensis]|nr:multicopper oxidase family protein [Stappia taiwanensis]
MMIGRRQFLSQSAAMVAATSLATWHGAFAADGVLELRARRAEQKLLGQRGAVSPLWTYNGRAPGPEIRLRKGERVQARLINELEEATSIHWHGIRIVNAMDGVAGLTQQAVPPGGTFDYDFVVPDAGTYWYHAHNRSWNQVARGLYGALIVDEEGPVFPPEQDHVLLLDDWRVDGSGALETASFGALMDWSHGGRLGNLLTVNGAIRPVLSLSANRPHRLRLINAANARVLQLDPASFGARVLAYDGQALPEPATLDYAPFLLGPAQRVDLLVTPEAGQDFSLDELSQGQPYPLADFRVTGTAGQSAPAPVLSVNDLPEPDMGAARTVTLDMTGGMMGRLDDIVYRGRQLEGEDLRRTGQMWALNGVANLADEPLFRARRGETILLETINNTAFVHAMHVHGHHFRITERVGSTVDEGRPWRDTFLIGPGQTTRVAFICDNPGKWLLHCHMLEHAAAGMNTWFDVA